MTAKVVVVGSGVAGLMAALTAASTGATVTLLEKAPLLGGTTALSGGLAWLPGNHLASGDSTEGARTYLRSLPHGDIDEGLVDRFVEDAPDTAKAVERLSELRWQSVPYPDYHAERPGGSLGGRSVEPRPLRATPAVAAMVRPAPAVRAPVTYREIADGSVSGEALKERVDAGAITMGRALVAGLADALIGAGGEIRSSTPAESLVVENGAVAGVEADGGVVRASVVLASGGFERNEELARTFLRGPMSAPTGAPGSDGDGLQMALGAGAMLGNMSEAWWCPAMHVPGESIDGEPMYRLVLTERARPHSLMVDGHGRRFVDEAQNYNDVGRTLHAFDAGEYSFPRVPAWLIFDGTYRKRYHFGPVRRDAPEPPWLISAGSLSDLASEIGIDVSALEATVHRFNSYARSGVDPDFGRGTRAYDRFVGDQKAADPTLGEVADAPFYAIEIIPGCLGTKGGPRTDGDGRVLSAGGGVVRGLYAAGNVAASPFGMAYPGAGGTIGPALVFGRNAGLAAVAE